MLCVGLLLILLSSLARKHRRYKYRKVQIRKDANAKGIQIPKDTNTKRHISQKVQMPKKYQRIQIEKLPNTKRYKYKSYECNKTNTQKNEVPKVTRAKLTWRLWRERLREIVSNEKSMRSSFMVYVGACLPTYRVRREMLWKVVSNEKSMRGF